MPFYKRALILCLVLAAAAYAAYFFIYRPGDPHTLDRHSKEVDAVFDVVFRNLEALYQEDAASSSHVPSSWEHVESDMDMGQGFLFAVECRCGNDQCSATMVGSPYGLDPEGYVPGLEFTRTRTVCAPDRS